MSYSEQKLHLEENKTSLDRFIDSAAKYRKPVLIALMVAAGTFIVKEALSDQTAKEMKQAVERAQKINPTTSHKILIQKFDQ